MQQESQEAQDPKRKHYPIYSRDSSSPRRRICDLVVDNREGQKIYLEMKLSKGRYEQIDLDVLVHQINEILKQNDA